MTNKTKKRTLLGILSISLVSLLISVPNMTAQMAGRPIVRASIPFAFVVGHTEMPAGDYVISYSNWATVLIWDTKTAQAVTSQFWPEEMRRANSSPRLVFHGYGHKYFLSQISRGFGNDMIELPTSKLEKEAQKAMRGISTQNVTVAQK